MNINLLTIFPDYFHTPLRTSILKRAGETGVATYRTIDIRDFATDKHLTTDDHPYGGDAGMVMKVEPIDRALESIGERRGHVILTSAKGNRFTQLDARRLAGLANLTIIAGHYEGVDERVAEHLVDEELRIGDYVLTGGEPAALVIIDAVVRLLPGVLGNDASLVGESHERPGQLSYPQYTRPEEYKCWRVPSTLLTGNHAEIEAWRVQRGRMDSNDKAG